MSVRPTHPDFFSTVLTQAIRMELKNNRLSPTSGLQIPRVQETGKGREG